MGLRCVTLFIVLCISRQAGAQATLPYDTSYRYYYYDQKLSMFSESTVHKPAAVFFGDSITDGCEWSEFFPGKLVLNRGISADNSFGLLYRLHEVLKRQPQKLFILIGINDLARGIPVPVILGNIDTLVQRVKRHSPGTTLILQSVLPTNPAFTTFAKHQGKEKELAALNAGIEALATREEVFFLDLYSAFANAEGVLPATYTNDGLHLTGAGYQLWTTAIRNVGWL
ncbi:MAG: GDSL-type esterase/lipase family protein [Chitinophagaceae bacterium]|nr:GDSL-type esterase/lipase family protein [Chitinophagaceae bacterium]